MFNISRWFLLPAVVPAAAMLFEKLVYRGHLKELHLLFIPKSNRRSETTLFLVGEICCVYFRYCW